ncbi:MAG: CHY zinc finger protein [Pseudomonadota bacterium]
MQRTIHGQQVVGLEVDAQTRCDHWHSELDIIALKFKCCNTWYPCFDCHQALADHPPQVWPLAEREEKAVLCGACGELLSITDYLNCQSVCPNCRSQFNPGCALHYHLYFEPSPR